MSKLFSQSLYEFVGSKVNLSALTIIAGMSYFFMSGYITFPEYMSVVTPAISAMGLRDTMFLLKK